MALKRPKGPRPRAHASASLAIMLVDGTRIRQKIRREYEKVRRDFELAQEELERFEQKDVPAYNRWFAHKFGSLLSELRETTRRVRELEHLFMEIRAEMLYSGAGEGEAYTRVMNRREKPEPLDDSRHGPGSRKRRNGEDRAYFEEDFTGERPPFEEFFGFGGNAPSSRNGAPPNERLKELYRALARRLHPDAQQEMTPQKREWWHQTQEAYEAGDVEQLEQILGTCEIVLAGTTEKATLSMLQRLSAQFKKSLRHLRRQLTTNRKDPAWNFSKRADIEVLGAAMRRQMSHDLRRLKAQLDSMELEIAAISEQARRRRAPRVRKRVVADPLEFSFQ